MNERIRELAEQAEIYAGELIDEGADYNQYPRYYTEKFAELIVEECASIVEGSPWNLPRGYKAVDQANLIKKHFGVE